MKAELYNSQHISGKHIAIIGGGVASACLIDHIFKREPNAKVTLFCRNDEIGSRGSSNKQGAVYPLLQGSKSVISDFYATCFQYAVDYYRQLETLPINFDSNWCGVLQQAHTLELEKRYQAVASVWPELCQYIDENQSSQLANISLPYPSIHIANGGWLSPKLLTQSLINYYQNQFSLVVKNNYKVTNLYKENNDWQIADQKFDKVVIAAGFETIEIKQTSNLPIEPVRGQVSSFDNTSALNQLKTVLCHKGYVTPSQGQYQCFGATFKKNVTNESNLLEEQTQNLHQIKSIYSDEPWSQQLTCAQVNDNNAAIRAMSTDHLPLVGEVFSNDWIQQNVDKNNGKMKRKDKLTNGLTDYSESENKGLYIFSGLGARGLTSAPLMAKHLVQLMFNEVSLSERLQIAVAPNRFQIRALKRQKFL